MAEADGLQTLLLRSRISRGFGLIDFISRHSFGIDGRALLSSTASNFLRSFTHSTSHKKKGLETSEREIHSEKAVSLSQPRKL